MEYKPEKYIVWVDYGYDGWHPFSYSTLEQTLNHKCYEKTIITKLVEYTISEIPDNEM